MREHQIVINLKPEQFEQIQKLARTAGSKSVSVYARQRLLSVLGMSGAAAASKTFVQPDWNQITSELRRLHRELQGLLAESRPPDSYPVGDDRAFEAALLESSYAPDVYRQSQSMNLPSITDDIPHPEESGLDTQATAALEAALDDELEELADRAFSISPRLGALEHYTLDEVAPEDPLAELLDGALPPSKVELEVQDNVMDPDSQGSQPALDEENEDLAQAADDTQSDDDNWSPQYEPDPLARPGDPPFSGGPPPRKRKT